MPLRLDWLRVIEDAQEHFDVDKKRAEVKRVGRSKLTIRGNLAGLMRDFHSAAQLSPSLSSLVPRPHYAADVLAVLRGEAFAVPLKAYQTNEREPYETSTGETR
jgi:hypothetical protein